MVVDGGLFYDGIDGFDYEPGYDYRLRIGKYDPWGGESRRRMPGGTPIVCNTEQLEKTPGAPSTPATLSLAPTRVTCIQGDDFCLVLDGELYDDMITSFEYEAGERTTWLDANDGIASGRYVLNEVSSRDQGSRAPEEEITAMRIAHRVECGRRPSRVLQGRERRGRTAARSSASSLRTIMTTACSSSGSTCSPRGDRGVPYVPSRSVTAGWRRSSVRAVDSSWADPMTFVRHFRPELADNAPARARRRCRTQIGAYLSAKTITVGLLCESLTRGELVQRLSGSRSMTVQQDERAARSGTRRPCSHSCTARTSSPKLSANFWRLSFIRLRRRQDVLGCRVVEDSAGKGCGAMHMGEHFAEGPSSSRPRSVRRLVIGITPPS